MLRSTALRKRLAQSIYFWIFLLLLTTAPGAVPCTAAATVSDTENCLLCHRYPGIGRYDKEGKKRIFYINESNFSHSVHGKLRCKNCHVGLDQIPHTDVQKVDCATKCHIEEPSTNKEFSHANMIDRYRTSVHGPGDKANPKPFPEDLPTCKYCHKNRLYNPMRNFWGNTEALSNETLTRCQGCHTNKDWAKRFYSHFTHRMRKRRTQTEIVALCTSCHEDREKMARHGLESIETYKDTYHWVQVKYQVRNAPDCISCHIPVGFSTHDLKPRNDELSPLHPANRVQTCSNQGGLQQCHPNATQAFASGRVHAYGLKAQLRAGNATDVTEDPNRVLVAERAEKDFQSREVFHYQVLKLIRLFYQVMIGCVIGFMCVHQLLDYRRTRKELSLDHPIHPK